MRLRNIGIVIGREYSTRVKKKSFIITTLLVPVLLFLCSVAFGILIATSKDKTKAVAVVDESGVVMPYLKDSKTISYQDMSTLQLDTVKAHLSDMNLDGVLYISKFDEEMNLNATFTSLKPVGLGVTEEMSRYIDDAVEDARIESYDIDGLKEIMEKIQSNVRVSAYTMDDSGEEKVSESGVNSILSMFLGIIIFMFIAMFGGMVMSSVIEEKNSRVVEVLISSVKATELMFGKIIGVALVALTQFLLWIVFAAIILGATAGIVSPKIMNSVDAQAIVESMPAGTSNMDAMTAVLAQTDAEAADMLGTLAGLNIPMMVAYFIVFFLLGYLLYGSLYAAIGSAVENENDSSQLQMPITIPLMIAYLIALYAYNAPDSTVALWGSMIPFTSPIVMLARIPFGVPAWQIALSIVLLLATTVLCVWISARIYKVGILMFGKKTTWKELWKWLKQK